MNTELLQLAARDARGLAIDAVVGMFDGQPLGWGIRKQVAMLSARRSLTALTLLTSDLVGDVACAALVLLAE